MQMLEFLVEVNMGDDADAQRIIINESLIGN